MDITVGLYCLYITVLKESKTCHYYSNSSFSLFVKRAMHCGNCSIGRHVRNQSKQRSYRDKSKTRKNKLIVTEQLLYFQVNRTLVFLKLLHGYGGASTTKKQTWNARQIKVMRANLEWQTKSLGQKSWTPHYTKTPRVIENAEVY